MSKKHFNSSLRQCIHSCYEWSFLNECITERSFSNHSHFLVHFKWIILKAHICFSFLTCFKYNGKLYDDLLRSKYVIWNVIHPLGVDIYYRYICLHHKHIRRFKVAWKHLFFSNLIIILKILIVRIILYHIILLKIDLASFFVKIFQLNWFHEWL